MDYYCTKCGGTNTHPVVSVPSGDIISFGNGGTFQPVVGVSRCCLAGILNRWDIPYDYTPISITSGERFVTRDLIAIIRLCFAIGKSARSIRRDASGFYIQVRSNGHLELIHNILHPQLELPEGVYTGFDNGNPLCYTGVIVEYGSGTTQDGRIAS